MRSAITTSLFLTALLLPSISCVQAKALQGGFVIYGRVSLPNGRPASRVTVKINGLTGLERQTQTDDQGSYQFGGIPGGRYDLKATDPQDASLYSDQVEADTSRTVGNRMVVHLYMRSSTPNAKGDDKPGVLSVAEAAQRVPKDARKAYEQGIRFREAKKLDRALTSFDTAVRFYPDYFQAFAARGDLNVSNGKITEASKDFDSALKFNEAYGPALRGAGFCKLQQQQFTEAARYLVRALETDANDASSHLFLGITLIALNQSGLAKEAFHQALKLDGEGTVTARVYMADIHARNRQFREAADELQIYLKARPTAPNAGKLKAMEADFRVRAAAQPK